jgi:hypothetical protein
MPNNKKQQWTWVKHFNTDEDNTTYDSGRITLFFVVFGIVSFAILVMCGLQIWDVVVNLVEFKPNDFGIGVMGLLGGVAGVLSGLGLYLFGQKRDSGAYQMIESTRQQGASDGNSIQKGSTQTQKATSRASTIAKSATTSKNTQIG